MARWQGQKLKQEPEQPGQNAKKKRCSATYSFLDHTVLFELLPQNALLSVPGKASARILVSCRGARMETVLARRTSKRFLTQ